MTIACKKALIIIKNKPNVNVRQVLWVDLYLFDLYNVEVSKLLSDFYAPEKH